MKRWLCGLLVLMLAQASSAHEVRHEITATDAVLVRLTFADGQPLAYEPYELYLGEATAPLQVGRTDAQGRLTFIAPSDQPHRLRAFTADGHGVDVRFVPPTRSPSSELASCSLPRSVLALVGLAVILALFGVLQLFIRYGKNR